VRRILLLVGIFTLLVSSMLASPYAASATVRDSHPYGVTLNAKDVNSFTDGSASLFKRITWARLQFSWKKGDWAQDDAQMALAEKYGIYPDIVLQNPPQEDYQPGCTQMPTPSSITAYALQVFQRYGNRAKSLEVLNEEPAFDHGVAYCKSAQDYISVLTPVVSALRNAGYTGLIGMFGYTNYSSVQQVSDFFTAFYSDPSNPGKLINYSNAHFYHHGAPPDVALPGKPTLMSVVNAIHQAALAAHHGEQSTWITELGYCVVVNVCAHPVSFQQQADYEQQAFHDGENSKGFLTHIFIFTMSDENVPFNVINSDNSPRPAYTMIQNEATMHPTW
jgi:hypothetical protein